jgi:hypothetical protein
MQRRIRAIEMNVILKRTDFLADGIFGNLYDENNKLLFATLEHAFDSGAGDGSFAPKIPSGSYKCVRGQHQLAHMTQPFITFEVTNVPGHTNILFHQGNFNKDSEGCILLGTLRVNDTIIHSADAFKSFMNLEDNIDQFILTVT